MGMKLMVLNIINVITSQIKVLPPFITGGMSLGPIGPMLSGPLIGNWREKNCLINRTVAAIHVTRKYV